MQATGTKAITTSQTVVVAGRVNLAASEELQLYGTVTIANQERQQAGAKNGEN